MEALSKMITVTVDQSLLSGFSARSRPPTVNISHLLFVDDTLIFCGANLITFAISVFYSYFLKLFMIKG
jgi:hypothetical protein